MVVFILILQISARSAAAAAAVMVVSKLATIGIHFVRLSRPLAKFLQTMRGRPHPALSLQIKDETGKRQRGVDNIIVCKGWIGLPPPPP